MALMTIGWLATAGVLAHNVEEARGLPAWSRDAGWWYPPVGAAEFRFAAGVLSLALVAAAAFAQAGGPRSLALHGFAAYLAAMVLNGLTHGVATVASRRYMPGTLTALLLNLPLGTAFIVRGLREGALAPTTLWLTGAVVVGVLLVSMPLLFALGRRLRPAGGTA
jgi:Protein of unknown function with HXXEE motif